MGLDKSKKSTYRVETRISSQWTKVSTQTTQSSTPNSTKKTTFQRTPEINYKTSNKNTEGLIIQESRIVNPDTVQTLKATPTQ